MSKNLHCAEENYQKALQIKISHYGEDHFELADIYNNLGIVLMDRSELNRAEDNFQKSQKIKIAQYGEDHFQLADIYNNYGNVFYQ